MAAAGAVASGFAGAAAINSPAGTIEAVGAVVAPEQPRGFSVALPSILLRSKPQPIQAIAAISSPVSSIHAEGESWFSVDWIEADDLEALAVMELCEVY